ncbi:hypothetical protein [Polyangium mundeleinium]|uniref:Transposase (putative) YhgA-like domain-containing protein n=1 Tax=Polyangium mundeleinium TaxID=2995306 RepID=A0ABT5F1X4_9BACT|nr:hypothetical protein [Polyangium mundeleinium]MDC0747584.1 hypothetical protein [Polyangium mundeleinium]
MPTLEHNGLVDMFRENPALAPHLVELLFRMDLPPYATVTVVETALDQLVPVEFRADLVLELRDEHGALVFAIVLEVQRDKDARKKYAWPVYVGVVRAQKGQSEGKATFPPFAQQIFDRGMHEGELRGELKGMLAGKRDALLRLLARAGISLAEDDRARIEACMDTDTLDRWVENVLGAKTSRDVFA